MTRPREHGLPEGQSPYITYGMLEDEKVAYRYCERGQIAAAIRQVRRALQHGIDPASAVRGLLDVEAFLGHPATYDFATEDSCSCPACVKWREEAGL